tara:strand:+ start:189 stop:458 length:270 start_codon:yes stop_codon:yes gene_type:complete
MLKREFRRKYPNNPDEGYGYKNDDECNRFTTQLDPLSNYYRPEKPFIEDVRLEYCKLYGYNFDQYKADWRSIERINPKTKRFYKSRKYQ